MSSNPGARLIVVLALAASALWPQIEATALRGDCGQPVSNGATPTASDCLYILKTAVGAETCTPECICDVNAAGGVTASDALTCLKKAVGQNVQLNCGAGCISTTTTTLPPVLTTQLVVFTKSQGAYATSALAGTWDLSALATGADAPYWSRGSLNVQSNGNFSGSVTDSDGAVDNVAGKLAVSSSGVVTCVTSQCPLEFSGAMDSGKTFMAVTYTWESGTTELLLATKRAPSYAQADLAGTCESNDMASVPAFPWWGRGTLTIQPGGATSGAITGSDGRVDQLSFTLKLAGNGAITCTSGCDTAPRGALDSGKTIATVTYTDDGGAAHLMVLVRKAASYAQSNLTGTWHLNALSSGAEAPLWTRGTLVVQAGGAFSGTLANSTGPDENAAGVLTLSAGGLATVVGDPTLRCALDAGKTVMVCTGN
jgi:hypothetical protein